MNKILMILSLIVFSSCSVVGPGERGVSVFMGEASEQVKGPGFYLWIPFIRSTAQISVQVQKSESQTTAASRDLQQITTTVAINWHVNPETVVKMYKEIGDEDEIKSRIIDPAVSEVFKASTAKLTAEEILTKRLELTHGIDTSLKDRLMRYGVVVDDVSLVDLNFSANFNHAVEQKQIAEQSAKQAEYEAQKAKIDATARVNQADGMARAALIAAKAEAEANSLKLKTLTPQLIQYEAIQKWDGSVPQVMGGSQMLFNLPLNQKAKSNE